MGVHPRLVTAIREILAEMAAAGAAMFVVEGVRTTERQQQLYAEGRSAPGRIVTYKDGVTHRSNHQPHADGFGYAVDCAFLNARDPFDHAWPWETYGDKLEARGLVWGGRWRMGDLPHAELPAESELKSA